MLRIVGRPKGAAIEPYHRRQHGDVRAINDLGVATGDVRLPAGKWLMFWRVDEGSPQVREFELRRGAVTEVDLGGDR